MTDANVVHSSNKPGYRLQSGRLVPKGYRLDDTNNPAKSPWTSKTLWLALVTAVAAFFPSVQDFVSAHPEIVAQVIAGIFFVLRFLTKGAVTLGD